MRQNRKKKIWCLYQCSSVRVKIDEAKWNKVFTPFLNKAQNKSPQYVRMHARPHHAIVHRKEEQREKKLCHNCAFTFKLNKRKNLIDEIYLNFMCGRHRFLLRSQNARVNSIYSLQCRHCRHRWFSILCVCAFLSLSLSLSQPRTKSLHSECVCAYERDQFIFFIKIKVHGGSTAEPFSNQI